ncbi:PIN domain-containing protein [Cupriavidus oxalaticus]|uniref:PIN domain-containing protein n=1 Tax=Cupriavidus oxalaticus TaxID=96344 RepID=UPI001F1119C5|nr:PIN domain-containing protein [Cupriavidus oxalaticus]
MLVDFENVQSIDFARLGDARLTVFAGESQRKVPIELAMGLHALGDKARWVRASGAGPNALDFHIAFELGRMVEAGEKGPVVVLSKDKGFDPLLAWLNVDAGVSARRVATLEEAFGSTSRLAAPFDADAPQVPSLTVELSVTKLEAAPMPPTLQSLAAPPEKEPTATTPSLIPVKSLIRGKPAKPEKAAATKGAPTSASKGTVKAIALGKTAAGGNGPSADRAREILARSRKPARPRRRSTLAKHIKAMFKAHDLAEREVEAIIAKLLANRSITENQGAISYNF